MQKNSSDKSSETSSYVPPKSPVKIPKGDKGYAFVKKAFSKTFEKTIMKFKDFMDETKKGKN